MISIIDTSVLITFYQLNSLELLGNIFNEVYVPITVEQQFLKQDTEARLNFLFNFYEENPWFKKCQTYQEEVIVLLASDRRIDEGEREAIAQYKKIQVDLNVEEGRIFCIIDEKYARKIASRMEVEISGTLYLLAKLHYLGYLDYETTITNLNKSRRFGLKFVNEAFEKAKRDLGLG